MGINLSKGQRINLSKESEGLQKLHIGLGWDAKPGAPVGEGFDLDAMACILGADGKALSENNFIYFGNQTSPCGAIVLSGDNRTGEGDGDDEYIKIDIPKLPEEAAKVVVFVDMHEAQKLGQNFGLVDNAICRLVDEDKEDEEMARFDLSFDASMATALIFGELIKRNDEWYFNPTGEEVEGGASAIITRYGLG
jgi:tellurium resistance protein TerD